MPLTAEHAGAPTPGSTVVSVFRDEALFIVDSSLRVLHARDRWGDGLPAGGAPGFDDLVPAWAAGPVREAVHGSLSGTVTDVRIAPDDAGAPLDVTASPVHSQAGDVVASVVVLREGPSGPPSGGPNAVVPRRALLLSLSRTPAAVVVLRAPAGYGKTTLLRQWDASDPRPFAWATLGPEHDDPEQLSAAIAAALAGTAGTPRRGRRAGIEAFLSREGAPSQVLVLDDAHHLTTGPALAMVERIATGLPEGSRLVLASREELGDGAVARLIRSRPVMRMTADDLSMSASEGRALFEAGGLDVPGEQIERVVRRTGGWPLGLQVSMLATRLHDVPAAQIGESPIPEQVVQEVLREEFLRPLAEHDQEFLAATAVAERLNGELCDAILGVEGSAETLRRLERSNVPIARLDETGEWFRLQGLFRDMLLDDLTRRRPAAVRRAHQRASAWLERRGDTAAATNHAQAGGDLRQAGRLLLELASTSLLVRDQAVAGIGDRFTRAEIRDEPSLAAAFGWMALGRGAIDGAMSYAVVGRNAQAGGADAEARAALELLAAVVAADGCHAMRDAAVRAVELAPPGSVWEIVAQYVHGAALQLAGDEGAADRLEHACRLGELLPPGIRALANGQLALAAINDDDRGAAQLRAEEAQKLAGSDGSATALSHALLALLRAKAGSDSAARERYGAAVAAMDSVPTPPPWLRALTLSVLCRAAVQLGNGNDARVHLEAARAAWPQGRTDAAGLNAELDALAATLDAFPAVSLDRAGHLTPAELRVLRLLPTHLSFREIGDHLFLSRHTVKTEAISTYRKLGVTSRSEAVRRAGELGLL
ncbi:MAG TPA: LuxR C-terminal-related transcriptional regulator [Gaiellales bacterium]|nr:LuxR C-terminal-related transcriptional regulator [Gaiellales bacterium]